MPKMFGFSRRKMKLGRLKSHQGDSLHAPRSPVRPVKRLSQSNGENLIATSVSGRIDELECQYLSGTSDYNGPVFDHTDNWTVISTEGDRPAPRFSHAAAMIGSKMVVVGGDSGHHLLDDTRILSLDKLTWALASPKIYLSPSGRSSKIPACKGHCLVPWGKTIILVGGKTEPSSERVSVWSFDVETECWSRLEAKGEIPSARSGHTVTRAGQHLFLFGGENSKGKKLNDLHMFDLKSSTWLPLRYKGTGPSSRSNHVAALHEDRNLFIFGGHSKSKTLNDLYSLDFETMVWSRIKTRGIHPSPRAGCCGALCGNKWYISGGGSKKKRHAETIVLDVVRFEWSECVTPPGSSITSNKGFSMVSLCQRDRVVLVAFGGNRKEPSDKVEILAQFQNDHAMSWRSAPDTDRSSYQDEYPLSNKVTRLYSFDSVARHSLASAVQDPEASGRRSFSDTLVEVANGSGSGNGSVSLRKQFSQEEESSLAQKLLRPVDDEKIRGSFQEKVRVSNPSEVYQSHDAKITNLIKRNHLLEEQLQALLESKETVEKDFNVAVKAKEEVERRLEEALKEVQLLKEKVSGLELAQEEANSLSNSVHSDNVRLEHQVAYLKAVLDGTWKELDTTRRVLSGERTRAMQLQNELYHIKHRYQTMENRAPTPRKH
ncbi:Galactose oxidase/kelch repeat superfamily protein [Rhynchospora pubera]|uniref:Galactose oxidase/kelch repeat superfamily protein n=1 Tax=Rhynchospora pubera TaxID=906938 RepID=A0AAV8DV68_9POAL|nr:Galactose oxidase/kelch repeat superfamily protein [Rhynchospora pubera]